MTHADDLRIWADTDDVPLAATCIDLHAAADYIEQLEAELRFVANECWGTGGEFWTGTAKMDRLPILSAMITELEVDS